MSTAKLRYRVLSAPQQFGCAFRFLVSEFHPLPFDTEADSGPEPELASPSTFSDVLKQVPVQNIIGPQQKALRLPLPPFLFGRTNP